MDYRKYKNQNVPIDDISFDLENPRIARFLDMYFGEITADQIALALGLGSSDEPKNSSVRTTSFYSLKTSIKTFGGIIHPIIVNKTDSVMTVIEGNTRLAIYKEFREAKVPGDWDKIPAIVYENLKKEFIDSLRLQSHLVGPRDWNPYSKAKYLNTLFEEENLTKAQIVDYCGGRESEVERYIQAYKDIETYYRPQLSSGNYFDPQRFSGFVELQVPRVIQAISDTGYTKNDFAKWIIDEKIHKNERVRKLPQVLRNKEAKEIFIKGKRKSIDKALKVLESKADSKDLKEASLQQLCNALVIKIQDLEFQELQALKEEKDSENFQPIIEAKERIDELLEMIDYCD